MFLEAITKAYANHHGAKRHPLLPLFIALVFALTMYPTKAHAQLAGNVEVNIPFSFYVGDTKLPPGDYLVHMRNDSDLTVMEITSVDGSISALFDIKEKEANSAPPKGELVFNKYGNQYFLDQVFDEGDSSGSKLVESRYEKNLGAAAAEAQEHVPTHHQKPQTN